MNTQAVFKSCTLFFLIISFSITQLAAGVVGAATSRRGQGGTGNGDPLNLVPDNLLLSAELLPNSQYEISYDPLSASPEIYNFTGLKSVLVTQDIVLTFEDPISWSDFGSATSLDFRYIAYDQVRFSSIYSTQQGADSRTLIMSVQVIHYNSFDTHQSGDYNFKLIVGMGLIMADYYTATFEYALAPPQVQVLADGKRGELADLSSQTFSVNLLPSSSLMNIQYSLPEEGRVSAEVFGLNGVRVKELIVPTVKRKGLHKKAFSLTSLAPGFYFIRFQYKGQLKSLKFLKG